MNWKSIIYRKRAIHRTEIERPLLAVKGFNTNLLHVLLMCHVIISNVHVCSFTGTISHVHGCEHKTVLRAWNLEYEKLWFMKGCKVWKKNRFANKQLMLFLNVYIKQFF